VRRRASPGDIAYLKAVAAFQWDWRVAEELFAGLSDVVLDIRRGRVRYVIVGGRVYLTLRPGDGFFSLSLEAGERVRRASQPPRYRIIVEEGVEIRGSVLAPAVRGMDPGLRPGDEALVVGEGDELLGVARVRVPAVMVNGLRRGEVARVRSRRVSKGGGGR